MSFSFSDVVKAVYDKCPQFNDVALRDFVQDSINESPNFPKMVLTEGFKFVSDDLHFVGHEILSPEDRLRFELRPTINKSVKAKIPLTVSHLRLVSYNIRFGDQMLKPVILYTPYLHDGMLHIKDKRSMIRKIILEKTFSRVKEKDKDGISVSPIRVNMTFNRRKPVTIRSYVNKHAAYTHFIVSARMFHGKTRYRQHITVLHYILAKFGFKETLKQFGLRPDDVSFVPDIKLDTDNYEYFAARLNDDRTSNEGPGLFLRVKKTLMYDDQTAKFVVNLVHILSLPFCQLQSIDTVYADDQETIWKMMLGILLFEDRALLKAHSNAESHLKSADHFIDPLTQKRFENFGVVVDDIYDLLKHIFLNIDEYMVKNLVQDIYNSRVDVTNAILVESYAQRIFTSLYILAKKTNLTKTEVESALSFNAMMFMKIKAKTDDSKDYIGPPEIVGDNFLFSGGLNKIRMGGRAEERLHPSKLVVESINAIVGKKIGKTGYINPYVPIDEHGGIIHPDYARDIDLIAPYLPR